MKKDNGFVVPVLLGIIILLLVGGGVYIYKNQKAEAPDVIDTDTQNEISEPEILASLETNWQTIQTSISFRPTHPGTIAWLSPYSVQFIGNDNLLINFEDGYNPGMAVLNFTDNQFKILESFKNQADFTLADWQNLVKKYGDISYPVSTYTVSLMRNNEIVSFQELTKVPENVFVKDYFKTANTYTYKNHGFTIELPKGFVPEDEQSEGGPAYIIPLPVGVLVYVTNASFWEEWNIPQYSFLREQKIGETTFKVYTQQENKIYWFKKGNVGYEFNLSGYSFPSVDVVSFENIIKTFKFVGWPQTSSITVLSPNGGEKWKKGTIQTISWQDKDGAVAGTCTGIQNCTKKPGPYDISLELYNPCIGLDCPLINFTPPLSIAKGVYGLSYEWSVGKVSPNSGYANNLIPNFHQNYRIMVSRENPSVGDSSDVPFTIN